MTRACLITLGLLVPVSILTAIEPAAVEVKLQADDAKHKIPEQFRLESHSFPAKVTPKYELKYSGVEVSTVTFPSPVQTPHEINNTVHCEYFRPKKEGKFPAVLVLDVLDGQQVVSRGEAMWLAMHDVAAVVVVLPYYGPRRPTEGKHRLLVPDVDQSVQNVRQAVLDCRRAVAWMGSRPEIDANKLSLLGTSLGSLIGALVIASEPNLRSGCLLLGGGGLVDAFYDHPKAAILSQSLKAIGITKEVLRKKIDPVDPLTYATCLKGKDLLLIAASRDDVVSPEAMKRFWEASGKPKIVWVDATHVGAAFYAFPMMAAVIEHVKK